MSVERVDKNARERMLKLARQIREEKLTNTQFENECRSYLKNRGWRSWNNAPDSVVAAFMDWTYCLYSDFREETIRVGENRDTLDRLILFLQTEIPFDWPEARYTFSDDIQHYARRILRLLGRETPTRPEDPALEYWPFHTAEEYRTAYRSTNEVRNEDSEEADKQ